MSKRSGFLAVVLGLAALVPGGAAAADNRAAGRIDRSAVQRALDDLVEHGAAAGVQARITDGRHVLAARSGVAEWGTTEPVPLNGRFRIASITKTFVATVVLQLVGKGDVDLDAPVEHHLPGLLPDGESITVRMLLQHTSGLFDYVQAVPRDPASFEPIRYRHWEPAELIALSTARPLNFQPGTAWGYSNTNYIVAGLLIEQVTGKPFERAVEKWILQPLGLRATSLPGDSASIPGPHAHGYYTVGDEVVDITEFNPSPAWASGGMISTTADLDRFVDALLDGRLLAPAQMAEMTNVLPFTEGFGLGLGSLPLECGVTAWGFGGDIFGYSSIMLSSRDTAKRLVVSISHAPGHGERDDDYSALLNEAFCR